MVHTEKETTIKLLRQLIKVVNQMHHEFHHFDERLKVMQTEWDNLKDKVTKLTTVTASVKTLIQELLTKINAAPSIEEVKKITAEVGANVDALSEAVPANTPAEE